MGAEGMSLPLVWGKGMGGSGDGEILVAGIGGSCVEEGGGRRECYTLTGHEAAHTPPSLIGEHHHRVQWCIVKC